jgi:hypothetical protein
MNETNWGKYYDTEKYLLDNVGESFRKTGKLEPADFYTILIWKAERAKNRHKERLKKIAGGNFEGAVRKISSELSEGSEHRCRLEVLMTTWQFRLATASAILTILYPDDFTVYDWRVCEEVQHDYNPWCSRGFSEELWSYYESFKRAVIDKTPPDLTLREKDRFLIGRSTRRSIENDCKT